MTSTEINPNGYAVVYYGDSEVPQVCRGMSHGTLIGGTRYAIFNTAEEATEEFLRWPHYNDRYGIVPTRLVVVECSQYFLKESAES